MRVVEGGRKLAWGGPGANDYSGDVRRSGNRLTIAEADIVAEGGTVVATAIGTFASADA